MVITYQRGDAEELRVRLGADRGLASAARDHRQLLRAQGQGHIHTYFTHLYCYV